MMSDWKVDLVNDNVNELYVVFKGPADSALPLVSHAKVSLHTYRRVRWLYIADGALMRVQSGSRRAEGYHMLRCPLTTVVCRSI